MWFKIKQTLPSLAARTFERLIKAIRIAMKQVEAELQKKLPIAMAGGGYILHTDHSVSTRVEYETLKYFQRRGLEIGTYSTGD